MKVIKVTIEELNGEWTTRHGKKYYHEVSIESMSRAKYIKLIKQNYPHYTVTNDVMIAPSKNDRVEEVNNELIPVIRPWMEEQRKAFGKPNVVVFSNKDDEIIDIQEIKEQPPVLELINEDTGEVTNLSEQLNDIVEDVKFSGHNNEASAQPQSKTEPVMESKQAQANEPKQKNVVVEKLSLTVGYGVMSVTAPSHLILQTASDVLSRAAKAVAAVEVFALDKLAVLPEEAELTDGTKIPMTSEIARIIVKRRSRVIQGYVALPVTMLKALRSKEPAVKSEQA